MLVAATGRSVALLAGEEGAFRVSLALEGSGAQCIAAGGGAIFAGTHGRGLWRSRDGGRTWDDARLPATDVFAVAVGADAAVYAGCEPSALYRSDDGGEIWRELERLRSIPSAPTWSFPPRPWTSHVRWIAPSPHEPDVLLVGIELGGLMRSGDGGATWEDHRPGAKRDVHALAWHPTVAGRAYEAAGDGTAWSRDSGRSWIPADAGRDRNYAWALAVDPGDPETWWVSASTGPYAAHGGRYAEASLYRWDGEGWRTLSGPHEAMIYALLALDGALYAGFSDGRLAVSGDRGESWADVRLTGAPMPRIIALAGSS